MNDSQWPIRELNHIFFSLFDGTVESFVIKFPLTSSSKLSFVGWKEILKASIYPLKIAARWEFFAVQVTIRPAYPLRIGKRSDWWLDSAPRRIQNSSAAWLSVSGWPGWSYKCLCTRREGSVARRDTPAWVPPSWGKGYWGCSSYWGCSGWIPARRSPQMAPCWRSWRKWSLEARTWSERIKGWRSWSWRRGSF